jgi:hypothetical protein
VDSANGDEFPRSGEVFHALGLLSASDANIFNNDAAASTSEANLTPKPPVLFEENEKHDTTGGAKNKEEVMAQIKKLRRQALHKKHALKKSNPNSQNLADKEEEKKKGQDERTMTLLERLMSEMDTPKESQTNTLGGITLTTSRSSLLRDNGNDNLDKHIPLLVEQVVDEKDQVKCFGLELCRCVAVCFKKRTA